MSASRFITDLWSGNKTRQLPEFTLSCRTFRNEISAVCTLRSSQTTMEENILDANWDADLDASMETSMDVDVGSQHPVTSTPALSLETTGNGTSSDVHSESQEVDIAGSNRSGDTATSTSSAPATGN